MRSAGSLLAVRPGEGGLVGLLAALFATVEAGRGLGDVAVTTLFLSRVGAEYLPYLFIALGLASLVVALGYGAGIGALPRRPFLVGLLAGFAAILAILRLAAVSDSISVYGLLWVAVNVVNAILLTVIWTIAGTTLDPRQAKRLFPLCTSAAIGGSFAGTLASGPLTALLGTENLVLLDAGLLLAAAVFTDRIAKRFARPTRSPRTHAPLGARLRMGLEEVRRSPLLRLVAASYLLLAVLLFSVTYPYQGALQRAFEGDEAGLATFVGLILAGVTAVSFVVSIAIANRVYVRFGIATAILLLPLVYLVGFGVWLIQFTLATAVAFLFSLQVVQRSLSNAAWSAIYNVVPIERRPQALAFIDGVPGQLGTTLSGILLLVAGALFTTSQTPIFVTGALSAVACIWVVMLIRRRYGLALVQTLRRGLAEQVLEGGPGPEAIRGEPAVLAALRAALSDPSPATRRLVADLLGRIRDPDAVALLSGRLDDEDAGVRAGAVRALAAIEPSAVGLEAERLAADPDPTVRGELAAAVAAAGDAPRAREWLTDLLASDAENDRIAGLEAAGRASEQIGPALRPVVRQALADPVPTVRAAAARALAHRALDAHAYADGDDETAVTKALVAALDDEAVTVRRDAAAALSLRGDAGTNVVEVLTNGSERAQEAALLALAGSGEHLRAPVRTWALARVRDATRLRMLAAALDRTPTQGTPAAGIGAGVERPNLDFLVAVIKRRELRIQEQLLAAVAALGAPEATSLLRRCLRSIDPDIRAQAVEAIDALGDRQLGREFVGLLDADPGPSTTDHGAALRNLADDPDPWIRTFALRSISEWQPIAHRDLSQRVLNDPDPLARPNLGVMIRHGGEAMSETARTLGELDRMLFLHRVPLFGQLDPEDLQRIAATASERLYPAGETLMTEGDLGEELIVIVEGDVRVVHLDGDGERLLRTYQAGDHIGELAVLRDRPRAATVIAGEHGVRGLVIGGAALRSILQERPEAAMAMLATLAERISVQ